MYEFPTVIVVQLQWKCVFHVCVTPKTVWSLGEGQALDDLDKPIDTPPLSVLLTEKPQSGSVTVGKSLEWISVPLRLF